jgi:hypothetical protein
MSTTKLQPPWLASWLVFFCAPAPQSDAILGDLHEEFVVISEEAGATAARSWYWRNALRTIVDLLASAMRAAPFRLAGTLLSALFVQSYAFRSYAVVMNQVLNHYRMYESHPDAYVWFFNWGFNCWHLAIAFIFGMLVAAASRDREAITVLSFAAIQFGLLVTGIGFVLSIGHQVYWQPELWGLASIIATIAGAVLIRQWRGHHGREFSRT